MNTYYDYFKNACNVELDIKPPALIINYSP